VEQIATMAAPGLSEALLLVAIGLGTGAVGAVLGTGGGVFLIPILVVVFHVPMHFAVGTSIVSVVATSTAVAIGNVDRGTANMRLGMTLEIATSLGAIGGGLSAAWLAPQLLEVIFASVLLPTAVVMWIGRGETDSRRSAGSVESPNGPPARQAASQVASESYGWSFSERLGGAYDEPRLNQRIVYRLHRLWAGLMVSFVAGVMSGLLGIGGGVFKVPALHILCGMPIKAAAATSTFMIGVTAAASAFLYFGRGEVDAQYTSAIVIGVVIGSWVGAYVNQFVGGIAVKRVFAAVLIGVAAEMFARVYLPGWG
jgi:uncharacterized membrane protein YfcA